MVRTNPFEERLCELAQRLPPDGRWAISCGSALTLHGLDYTPNDLDFFAPCEDAYRIADSLKDLGVIFPFQLRESDMYRSYFGRFYTHGVEVETVLLLYHGQEQATRIAGQGEIEAQIGATPLSQAYDKHMRPVKVRCWWASHRTKVVVPAPPWLSRPARDHTCRSALSGVAISAPTLVIVERERAGSQSA